MNRWLATPILTLVVASMFAAPALGQNEKAKDLELNVFFGVSSHSKNQFKIGLPQASPPMDARFNLGDAFRGGIRFNVNNSGRWGQEFYYSYEDNRVHYVRGLNVSHLPIQLHNLGVNAMFYFDPDEDAKHRPFLSFGLGATIYKPTQESRVDARDPNVGNLPGFGQSNELSFNYGIGFKERLSRLVGLRLDVKHFIGRNPSFSLSRKSDNPAEPVFPNDGAIHSVEVTGGLVFYFGR